MNAKRKRLLQGATALTLISLLGACDLFAPREQPQPVAPQINGVDPNDRLDGLFDARPIAPSRITTSTQRVRLTMPPRGQDRATVRFINEGEATAQINSIVIGAPTDEITLGGSCTTVTELSGGRACDVTIQYNDASGSSYSTQLLFFTNAREGNDLRVPIDIVIQEVTDPQRETQIDAPAEQIIVDVYNPMAEEIARLRAERLARGVGRWTNEGRPVDVQTRLVEQDEGFDRQVFPSVETSLPVDRSRIITPDRVIPAILETPIHSPVTGHIVAVSSQHVYAGTGDRILIPAGTRFIGRTNGFADERAALVWERFITPDGVTVRMNAATQDQMGRAGAVGYLDRRIFDRFGMPLMLSTLQAVATFSFSENTELQRDQDGNVFETRSARNEALQDFRQSVQEQAQGLVQEFADVRRILSVPAGTRILIAPTEDLYFKSAREIVTVNAIEYEMRQRDRRPIINEAPAVFYEADAAGVLTQPGGFAGDGSIVTIGGREFRLTPLTREQMDQRARGQDTRPIQGPQPVVQGAQGDPRMQGGMQGGMPPSGDPRFIQQNPGWPPQSGGFPQNEQTFVVQPGFEDGYFRSAPR